MDLPLVVAVVLNWERHASTLACLDSLSRLTYARCEILVLDASADGCAGTIRTAFPDVEVIELSENHGYAGNNNVGIEAAIARGADWILLLNDDVVVAPDCVSELVRVAGSDAASGIVGPTVYHASEPGVIQSAGGLLDARWAPVIRGQDEQDSGQHAAPSQVDWVSGCAILIGREAIQEAGRFDERFFCYWEEVDLCLRVSRAGRSIVHAPGARVWHSGAPRGERPAAPVAYYMTRNRFLLMAKHRASRRAKLARWAGVGWTVTSWGLGPGRAAHREHRRAMLRGATDFTRSRYGRMPEP